MVNLCRTKPVKVQLDLPVILVPPALSSGAEALLSLLNAVIEANEDEVEVGQFKKI